MKKRILSFFLALVMLFSCLSLNVFATVSTGEEASQGEEVALGSHSDAEIESYLKQVSKTLGHGNRYDKNLLNTSTSLGSYNKGHMSLVDGRVAWSSGSGSSYIDMG